ncbi:MAG: SAM-dependent methyltransferase [Nitrococcus mobilis]|nr:SAM-dependent methyltransferase [Nitrococcus mobilis]
MHRSAHRAPLPMPDPSAAEHSARLAEHVRAAIGRAGGRLPFDHYMALALYEPGLGYYSAGQRRFGPAGDFTTAPLISELFARTLAQQVAQILAALDGGVVLELGAGTGHMAADLLSELERLERLPERYLILEVSAALREEQAQTIARSAPALRSRVEWLDRLPQTPLRGAVLANEVIDALPVKRFQITPKGLQEQVVTLAEDVTLTWALAPAGSELGAAVANIEAELGRRLPSGYVSEWCPQLTPWIASLAGVMEAGVALFIDYGYPRAEYYHPQRHMGTLLCHYRNRVHDDPLVLLGLQDITAFVDFTLAAQAGIEAGLEVLGFTTQAHFLIGAGLPRLLEAETVHAPEQAIHLTQQAKALLFPGQMGERYKVLALGRGIPMPLSGFSWIDFSNRMGCRQRATTY